jgi:hypothetical protein
LGVTADASPDHTGLAGNNRRRNGLDPRVIIWLDGKGQGAPPFEDLRLAHQRLGKKNATVRSHVPKAVVSMVVRWYIQLVVPKPKLRVLAWVPSLLSQRAFMKFIVCFHSCCCRCCCSVLRATMQRTGRAPVCEREIRQPYEGIDQ